MAASFSAEWLALREPADRRSRSRRVFDAIANALNRESAIDVLDLASGTGSNVLYLAPLLRGPVHWRLVDHDRALLTVAEQRIPFPVQTSAHDLSVLGAEDGIFASIELVTASALLDLVSEPWLRTMLARCRSQDAAVLFALTYDGRLVCEPEEPDDELVRGLVNRHQRIDKGFGPALGPEASAVAKRVLGELGYRVVSERSDWVIEADEQELQRQLLEGWAEAAFEVAPEARKTIECWLARRLEHLVDRRSRLLVGHDDIAGIPA